MNTLPVKKNFWLLIAVIVTAGVFSACSRDSTAKQALYRPGLMVLPKADDVQFRPQEGGYDLLEYTIHEQYPAKKALSEISERLKNGGWSPLRNDLLNPDSPSSHVTGWTQFVDATITPESRVHQWLAQWKDKEGNVVSYALRYREPDLTKLTIWALYYPSTVAKSLQEKTKTIRKSDPRFAPSSSDRQDTTHDQSERFTESGDLNLLLRASAENARLDLVKLTLSRGAKPDAADEHQYTALMAAARNGHTEIANLLIEKGANVNAIAEGGMTPLIVASKYGRVDIVRSLLQSGTDIYANSCGRTALRFAKENGHLTVVELLKKSGVKE